MDGGIQGRIIGLLMVPESVWFLADGNGMDTVKGHVFAQTWIKHESVVMRVRLNHDIKRATEETMAARRTARTEEGVFKMANVLPLTLTQ